VIFSLEVMRAKHGDCLILHSGTSDDPRIILIDGGPSGIFNSTLKPRLAEITTTLGMDTLPLDLVMVSHIDDDHINGIKAMTDAMVQSKADNEDVPWEINHLWCNNFDDIVGNIELPKVAGIAAGASVASVAEALIPGIKEKQPHVSAVIASVPQGRKVRKNAKTLGLEVNSPFGALKKGQEPMVRGDIGQKPISIAGATITVIHPNAERLKKLQEAWDKELKIAAANGDRDVVMATVAKLTTDKDTSPFNLSSIVCLVESKNGARILLTGDALMEDIEEALEEHQLFENGKLKVDIFKMPHHGSDKNATDSLLQKVEAKYYVISADGKYKNPDEKLLDMLAANLTTGTLCFTYEDGQEELGPKMKAFEDKLADNGSKLKVVYRKDDEASIVIDLEDVLNY
jgi:beta-lactamase superfamily II metal-dependent hydrolase